MIFDINLFIQWLEQKGESELAIEKILRKQDWHKFEGMSLEEVRKHVTYVCRQWFRQEER
jgi:hypothetical protein